jgi:hypothetical protein
VELHEAIILSLAISALILSIMSVAFGIIFFFRLQTQQAHKIMEDNSSFTLQMNILLNEIRTSQDVTGQQIKEQHDKLLDAAIHRSGSIEVAATSAVQFDELKQRLESLEKVAKGLA